MRKLKISLITAVIVLPLTILGIKVMEYFKEYEILIQEVNLDETHVYLETSSGTYGYPLDQTPLRFTDESQSYILRSKASKQVDLIYISNHKLEELETTLGRKINVLH